jgi:2,3-dihydroxybenzoate decarboxylase
VTEVYYADHIKKFPMVVRPAWGYTVGGDTAIGWCSGVFDAHPRLKVILGHLGETLPSWCGASIMPWRGRGRSR